MGRTTRYLLILNILIQLYVIFSFFILGRFFNGTRTIRNDVIQGILIGFSLAFVTAQIYAMIKTKKVNGWVTMYKLGDPRNGMLLRTAHAQLFPGPVNSAQEALYWWTNSDGGDHALSGANKYIMHFPAGQLPPNKGFWSITMGDSQNHFVDNPINRYCVNDRTGLKQNSDGSVDIYIQKAAPTGHEINWLPAPMGNFILWLRVYIPAETIINGKYIVPPVTEVKS